MTCIVSYIDKKKRTMWLGSDTLVSDGQLGYDRKESKTFETDDYLIGFCGNPRYFQIIKYSNGFPEPIGDLHKFMCSEFVQHVAMVCSNAGYLKKKDDTPRIPGYSVIIILIHGRSFTMYSDFQIEENTYRYSAIGAGAEVALGSLYTQDKGGMLARKPKEALTTSIKAASEFILSVGGRIQIKSKKY